LISPSKLPLNKRVPSGKNASAFTALSCPSSVAASLQSSAANDVPAAAAKARLT